MEEQRIIIITMILCSMFGVSGLHALNARDERMMEGKTNVVIVNSTEYYIQDELDERLGGTVYIDLGELGEKKIKEPYVIYKMVEVDKVDEVLKLEGVKIEGE